MALDPATFDTLYAMQADRLYSTCYRILRDEQQAQDAVQEVWLRAFSRDDDVPINNPAAWLTTVARNAALDQYRRRKHLAPLAEEADEGQAASPPLVEDDPYSDPAKAVPAGDQQHLALALIDELRPDQERLLQLHHVDGVAIPELAEIIGKTTNATTVALHRARAALRARYVDHVFARSALPEACRARKVELVAFASGSRSADVAAHLGSCSACQESVAELRSMSAPYAIAPLLFAPAALKGTVATALAAQQTVTGAGAATTAAGATSTGSSLPIGVQASANSLRTRFVELGIRGKLAILGGAGAVTLGMVVAIVAVSAPRPVPPLPLDVTASLVTGNQGRPLIVGDRYFANINVGNPNKVTVPLDLAFSVVGIDEQGREVPVSVTTPAWPGEGARLGIVYNQVANDEAGTQVVIDSHGVPLSGVRAQLRAVDWRTSGEVKPADLSKSIGLDAQGISFSGVPGVLRSKDVWRSDYGPAPGSDPATITGISINITNSTATDLTGFVHWRLDACDSKMKCTAYAEIGRAGGVTIPARGSAVVVTDDAATVAILREWFSKYKTTAITWHFLQDPHATALDRAPAYSPTR
jgi:RNA polymerase sigma-70 factor, ECF subfamily